MTAWWSDIDDEPFIPGTDVWQPVLSDGDEVIVSVPIWFYSKAECDAFIVDNLVGATFTDD